MMALILRSLPLTHPSFLSFLFSIPAFHLSFVLLLTEGSQLLLIIHKVLENEIFRHLTLYIKPPLRA